MLSFYFYYTILRPFCQGDFFIFTANFPLRPNSHLSVSMLQLLLAFQHPDILSHELIAVIVGIDPGGDALIVLVGDLIVVEVGADDGRAIPVHPGVDDIINGRLIELGVELRPQVIQDEQVTGQQQLQGVIVTACPAKMFPLHLAQKVNDRVIEDAVAPAQHLVVFFS